MAALMRGLRKLVRWGRPSEVGVDDQDPGDLDGNQAIRPPDYQT